MHNHCESKYSFKDEYALIIFIHKMYHHWQNLQNLSRSWFALWSLITWSSMGFLFNTNWRFFSFMNHDSQFSIYTVRTHFKKYQKFNLRDLQRDRLYKIGYLFIQTLTIFLKSGTLRTCNYNHLTQRHTQNPRNRIPRN